VSVARVFGRRLAYLLLMLTHGGAPNRAARPEWSDAHWAFWAEVRRVVVGGGLLAGALGRAALPAARELLAEHGSALSLEHSPFGPHLALVGLARLAAPSGRRLVFDFGQTAVKHGLARHTALRSPETGSALAELKVWPAAPTPCGDPEAPAADEGTVRARWAAMSALISADWRQAGGPAPALALSVACYLSGGHPSPAERGCYASLQSLGPNLAGFMRQALAEPLGQTPALALYHDGAAAALADTGPEPARTVVITLGTALGSGFPPEDPAAAGLLPLAADFRLTLAD
ncbi:MAG: hypothetical protein JNK29_05500, partial [Anaerolineales bacterium]|nr:hypothetical protein [Anaerolineales bacterium]